MGKFRPFLLSLLFICFGPFIGLLCAEENQDAAENIFRHAYHSISHIEDGRIFLKEDTLYFYQGKIYVEGFNGVGLAIPSVFSCSKGLYLKADGFNIFNTWKCSLCKKWNHNWDNPTHCCWCGTPRS